MKTISVLLADDHAIVRQGLGSLLSYEPDIKVVGEAVNGREAVRMAVELRPDVIVIDLGMPELNGVEAIRQIIRAGVPSKLLVLSSYDDDEYVERLAKEGVAGYLIKHTAATELIDAVREAPRATRFLGPMMSGRFRDPRRLCYSNGQLSPVRAGNITSREREVLKLIADGHPNKRMAILLGISIKTVEKHRQHLMDTLGIHDTAGLTRYAVAHGIVENTDRLDGVESMNSAPMVG
jgi:DNA-binding NarL/FixJ family response regulator